MATIAYPSDSERGEARFFFTMACVMAATIVAGFAFNLATGRSSFALPWLVHFHALVMMAWVGLYLTQNFLIFSDNIALHRRLGWLSKRMKAAKVIDPAQQGDRTRIWFGATVTIVDEDDAERQPQQLFRCGRLVLELPAVLDPDRGW